MPQNITNQQSDVIIKTEPKPVEDQLIPGLSNSETQINVDSRLQAPTEEAKPTEEPVVLSQKVVTEPTELDTPENNEATFIPQDEEVRKTKEEEVIEADTDTVVNEMDDSGISTSIEYHNFDKMNMAVPLSTPDKLWDLQNKDAAKHTDDFEQYVADMTSPIQTIGNARGSINNATNLYVDGFKRVGEDIHEKLKTSYKGIGDSNAGVPKKFKDQKVVTLSGPEALVTLTALTSGMRRITLWNSGFTITLRSIPLDLLNLFYKEVSHQDYEYGKVFGAFYYLFSDLSVTEFVINTLLPIAICGSNYAHWKDSEKLLKAISHQDYPVIMWAMACMMHPNGVNVNFVCAEENCGHIETKFVDLSKLRLINTDLINDKMIEHFKTPGWITDEMLDKFRKDSNLNRVIDVEYGEGLTKRHWKIHMKQSSLFDTVAVGKDYNAELVKRCSPDDQTEVTHYMFYNNFRPYKAWIDKIEIMAGEGEDAQTFIVENDGSTDNDRTIYALLEDLQQYHKKFGEDAKNYILDTKISHIAYYFPECPACKKAPTFGYNGYLPYDPMQNFFHLAVTKLLTAQRNAE